MVIIYLSSTLLLGSICLPISVSSITGTSGEQPSNADLCGISAYKVYPPDQLPGQTVSSYLTFSPFPRLPGVVIFCGTICCPYPSQARTQTPGSSPVHCSALSGLSSPFYNEAITRLVAIISKRQLQK